MKPVNSRPASAIRSQLQTTTRQLHLDVEAQLPLAPEQLEQASYTRLLEKLSALHGGLEATFLPYAARLNALGLEWEGCRRKLPLLAADLRALQGTLEKPAPVAPWESLSHVLGALYVVEGATLGGQVITRRLRDNLALTPEHGASYFASYGADVGLMWRRFCAALEGHATTPERVERATAAATSTFRLFLRYTA